ncbi:MAG: ABC transporter ATP-binding protein, partial [Oscillospiraceae bacterium]
HEGELVAVVGSSGSGKSLLAAGIMGVLPYNATMGGKIEFLGEELNESRIKNLRGKEIVLVPQSVEYLDPLMRVGEQITNGKKDKESTQKLDATLKEYGLKESTKDLYPFELSGGMARRILISTAVTQSPKLVIADEPTPGLDVKIARRVLSHFRSIADSGAGVLLITHDLELALEVADRIVVFYAGTTIEDSPVSDFNSEDTLRHPYSKALWRSMPQNGFSFIGGVQPYVKDMPIGCTFSPRCEHKTEKCCGEIPYVKIRDGYVRCINYSEEVKSNVT